MTRYEESIVCIARMKTIGKAYPKSEPRQQKQIIIKLASTGGIASGYPTLCRVPMALLKMQMK